MTKRGFRPPINEALHGFCCDCTANYGDGRIDCQHNHCPMYSKHRYRKMTPNFDWFFGPWSNHEKSHLALGMTREEYLDHKLGVDRKVSYLHMFRAKCFECCGNFIGGMKREDCRITTCPIYYWMPFREELPILDWVFDLNYTDRHRVTAIVEGYMIPGQNIHLIDRKRYLEDHFQWTGEPLIKQQVRRVRRIA